jgi:hypothetical protein
VVISGSKARALLDSNALEFMIDGGGSTPVTGLQLGSIPLPFNFLITAVQVDCSGVVGSMSFDVLRKTLADSGVPSLTDKISAAYPIVLTSVAKKFDTTLTGWSLQLYKYESIFIYLNSISTITASTIVLHGIRS